MTMEYGRYTGRLEDKALRIYSDYDYEKAAFVLNDDFSLDIEIDAEDYYGSFLTLNPEEVGMLVTLLRRVVG